MYPYLCVYIICYYAWQSLSLEVQWFISYCSKSRNSKHKAFLMNKTTDFSEKALAIIFQVSWGRKPHLKYWEGQRAVSHLQDVLCKTRSLGPQFEEITDSKKLSSVLFWSLNCFKISLGIFTSNHHTLKLLKQKKHKIFLKCLLQQYVRISWHSMYIHSFSWRGRFSLGRKFYFNFPSRCCHYGEIIIIWPILLKKRSYISYFICFPDKIGNIRSA